jgi:beta-phosphoglucomutase-like phosphatase (HAD superfamily)
MKTIVFDFDGTLTKKSHEIWGKMWEAIDALDVDYELYCKYKNKEIDYIKWCELIEIEFIKRGFNKDLLLDLANGIELMDNLENTLKTLKEIDDLKGEDLVLLSKDEFAQILQVFKFDNQEEKIKIFFNASVAIKVNQKFISDGEITVQDGSVNNYVRWLDEQVKYIKEYI